jgi:bacterioferritin
MSGHPRVVSFLQRALDHEFCAAQQFTLQAVQAEVQGMPELATELRMAAREELGHAEAFGAGLSALSITARSGAPRALPVGRSREDLLRFGLETEAAAIRLYSEARRFCETIGDAGNGALFARILDDELNHYRDLEKRLGSTGGAQARQ